MKSIKLLLLMILSVKFGFSQNLAIEKNKKFKEKGYIVYLVVVDSNLDFREDYFFLKGKSCFLDTINSSYKNKYYGIGYYPNSDIFIKELKKNRILGLNKRPLKHFKHPPSSTKSHISNKFYSAIYGYLPDTLKKGIYYRTQRVKYIGWIIDFANYSEYIDFYMLTSSDILGQYKYGNKYKRFEPALGQYTKPYQVLFSKAILYYSDWFLAPSDALYIDGFYKYIYKGPKTIKKTYPEALEYLKSQIDTTIKLY